MRWQNLQKKFVKAIQNSVGCSKISSGQIIVYYLSEEKVSVELGGYDIGDWNRHTHLGPFENEDKAFEETVKKVDEAIEILKTQERD